MFKKMNLKIKGLIVSTLSICVVVTGITCFFTIRRMILDDYINLSTLYIRQHNDSAHEYLNLIEEISMQALKNQVVIDTLDGSYNYRDKYDVISVLEDIKASSTSIIALSLYGTDGSLYTDIKNSSYLSLGDLRKNETIRKWMSSNQTKLWLLRRKDLSEIKYYNYDKNMGVLTLALKISDDKNLYGYLFIDLNINTYFNYFLSSNDASMQDMSIYIYSQEEGIIPYVKNSYGIDALVLNDIKAKPYSKENYILSSDGKYLILYGVNNATSFNIIMPMSMESLIGKLYCLLLLISIISFLLIILAILAGRTLSNSICKPLINLKNQMNRNSI